MPNVPGGSTSRGRPGQPMEPRSPSRCPSTSGRLGWSELSVHRSPSVKVRTSVGPGRFDGQGRRSCRSRPPEPPLPRGDPRGAPQGRRRRADRARRVGRRRWAGGCRRSSRWATARTRRPSLPRRGGRVGGIARRGRPPCQSARPATFAGSRQCSSVSSASASAARLAASPRHLAFENDASTITLSPRPGAAGPVTAWPGRWPRSSRPSRALAIGGRHVLQGVEPGQLLADLVGAQHGHPSSSPRAAARVVFPVPGRPPTTTSCTRASSRWRWHWTRSSARLGRRRSTPPCRQAILARTSAR